jgi:hypothetical protein
LGAEGELLVVAFVILVLFVGCLVLGLLLCDVLGVVRPEKGQGEPRTTDTGQARAHHAAKSTTAAALQILTLSHLSTNPGRSFIHLCA